ncbi:MAG TPA: hypothetical protein VMW32_00825 [Bacteroidales bacterium]|nr:hypothetical protein [Bacteroidales bacterium]
MKKLEKVKMIVDTDSNKIGDIRKLNPERAGAWVNAGWAEYVEKKKLKGINIKDIPGCGISEEKPISYGNSKPVDINKINESEVD